MKIVYCGELIRTPDAMDHRGIIQGLDWLKCDYKIVDPILTRTQEIAPIINDYKPDLVIHGNTDSFKDQIIPEIKAKQVFWMLDYQPEWVDPLYHGLWKQWCSYGKHLDAVFLSNYDQLDMWKEGFGCPTHFLPHGCIVDELQTKEEYKYKCVFIGGKENGGWLGKRWELIKNIKDVTYINEPDVKGRNRVWREMPAIYHSADTVLDVSHAWHVKGYASGRYWYSAGLGGCSITKRFPGCEEFYEDKVHKAYFDTADEANKLIEYYAMHEKEREDMKQAAWDHNKKEHNYKKRLLNMLELI